MKTKQEAIEIRRVFAETGGNVSETARRCGCGRDTVRRALKRDYGLINFLTRCVIYGIWSAPLNKQALAGCHYASRLFL